MVAEISQIYRDSMFYQKDSVMRNTADVTGGKPITVRLQSISGVSAAYQVLSLQNSDLFLVRSLKIMLRQGPFGLHAVYTLYTYAIAFVM
jgi:hypothetical protein